MEAQTIISLVIGGILVLGFIIRAEANSKQNASNNAELWERLEKHISDGSIHHPDDELDRRFKTLEDSIGRIEKGIERMDGRLDLVLRAK